MTSDGWLNGGLPFFNTVLTADGKTGRDLAFESLRRWYREAHAEAIVEDAVKAMIKAKFGTI